jgi:hypothetical protein
VTSSSKLRGALVMSEEGQGTFAAHIKRTCYKVCISAFHQLRARSRTFGHTPYSG